MTLRTVFVVCHSAVFTWGFYVPQLVMGACNAS